MLGNKASVNKDKFVFFKKKKKDFKHVYLGSHSSPS